MSEFSRREFQMLLGSTAMTLAARADAQQRGLLRATRSPRLGLPQNIPPGKVWNYTISFPFQIAPGVAGISVSIKPSFGPGQDYGGGCDVIPFSDRLKIDTRRAIPITRIELGTNPNAGGRPAEFAKYPDPPGFVPLGARRSDGSPHPHAGTGFGTARASAWHVEESAPPPRQGDRPLNRRSFYKGKEYYQYWELYQYSYDGKQFQVSKPRKLEETDFIPGWEISRPGLTAAIPDGDDLICAMCGGRPGKPQGSGIMRWRRVNGEWKPIDFQLVTGEGGAAGEEDIIGPSHSTQMEGVIEPSLIRDTDGELLLSGRGRLNSGHPIRVWKSSEKGRRWKLAIFNGGISSSPVTINRAADGTPYIAANRYQYQTHYKNTPSIPFFRGADGRPRPDGGTREVLMAWPLNEARNALEIPVYLRDGLAEFGPPPHGTVWTIDHPSAQTVQLEDGRWHNLIGYRVIEKEENVAFVGPTPYTGSYVEEVFSAGTPIPSWNF